MFDGDKKNWIWGVSISKSTKKKVACFVCGSISAS